MLRRTVTQYFVTASQNALLGEQQIAFGSTALSFAQEWLKPNASTWDAEGIFPRDVLKEAGKLGFGGLYTREPYGTAASRLDASVVFEQMAMEDPSTTAYLTIHNMCCWMIDSFGDEATRARLLPSLTSFERTASYCLTEPGSGSDAAALRTTVSEDGKTLTGQKAFISGAGESSVYVVMARVGSGNGPKGITACIVEGPQPKALTFGKNEKKLGWKSQPTRQTIFDGAQVSALLGKQGEGFKIAMKGLDGGRLNIASCSLGAAQRCFDLAVAYTKERKQFGQRIADFQNTQFRLTEMAGKIHSSRLLIRHAAICIDNGDKDATVLCALAKQQATDLCYEVVDQALQMHGGYGYLGDYQIERYLRDLRVHRILEGTNEIMKHIVSRAILS